MENLFEQVQNLFLRYKRETRLGIYTHYILCVFCMGFTVVRFWGLVLYTYHGSFKQRTQNTMVTKDWTTNLGLARLPNTAQKPILLINGDISQEQ